MTLLTYMLAVAFGYFTIAGAVMQYIQIKDMTSEPLVAAIIGGVIWPITVMFLLGRATTRWWVTWLARPRLKKVRYKCAECRRKTEEPNAATMGKEERFRA